MEQKWNLQEKLKNKHVKSATAYQASLPNANLLDNQRNQYRRNFQTGLVHWILHSRRAHLLELLKFQPERGISVIFLTQTVDLFLLPSSQTLLYFYTKSENNAFCGELSSWLLQEARKNRNFYHRVFVYSRVSIF